MHFNRYSKYFKLIFNAFIFIFIAFAVIKKTTRKPLIIKLIRFLPDLKYILIWTNIDKLDKDGQAYFIEQNCDYVNCYLTRNISIFGDVRYFDTVLFSVQDVSKYDSLIPRIRGHNQKYVFVANNSADNYPLKRTYYFYLAFEDSLADDYITDAVLIGYNNNAVPVVYGGAAYERFLPPGSYLNVHNNTPAQLAYKMNEIILNRELYHDFFRWKNHYIISKTRGLNGCDLCKLLNNPMHRLEKVSYVNFRKWWNPKYEQRCGLNNNIFLLKRTIKHRIHWILSTLRYPLLI
ncbi:unnamed protein product [Leptidea sinapis]|uniref:Fucosyltransferase n=1 Tax=Leptidea sinapis TaxID=189913 RepID=A0A5E4QRY5_9NEOP|nr:unnamed protein product [Leptidea sinapis]